MRWCGGRDPWIRRVFKVYEAARLISGFRWLHFGVVGPLVSELSRWRGLLGLLDTDLGIGSIEDCLLSTYTTRILIT